jgi:hypothetical protein
MREVKVGVDTQSYASILALPRARNLACGSYPISDWRHGRHFALRADVGFAAAMSGNLLCKERSGSVHIDEEPSELFVEGHSIRCGMNLQPRKAFVGGKSFKRVHHGPTNSLPLILRNDRDEPYGSGVGVRGPDIQPDGANGHIVANEQQGKVIFPTLVRMHLIIVSLAAQFEENVTPDRVIVLPLVSVLHL